MFTSKELSNTKIAIYKDGEFITTETGKNPFDAWLNFKYYYFHESSQAL